MTAAANIATWLKDWLATVPPGRCPACRRTLPQRTGRGRPAYVHSKKDNPECRAEYLRKRNEATSGSTSLREVKAFQFLPSGRALVTLDCGCVLDMPASRARRITKRAYCPKHSA